MIKWIRCKLAERKAQRYEDSFDKGFGWALVRYYRLGHPIEYIEDTMYGGSRQDTRNNHPFNDGAKAALLLVERLGPDSEGPF